jgi:hypothetical protein
MEAGGEVAMRSLLAAWAIGGSMVVGAVACAQLGATGFEETSDASAITMRLPPRDQFTAGPRARLSGYRVVLEPLGEGCPGATPVDVTAPWDSGALSQTIRQGCDWSIGVQLGELRQNALSKTFFSNWDGPGKGMRLPKEAIAGKPRISLGVELRITADGTAAGFDGAPPPPPEDVDAGVTDIDIVVGIRKDAGSDAAWPLPQGDYDWRASIQFETAPSVGWTGQTYGSPHFVDVMSRTRNRYLSSSHTTNAHETMHLFESEMRNARGIGWNYFYFEDGKGAYLRDPKMSSTRIREYVPARVRTLARARYDLYLVQQTSSWPNVLYQFDEWCAYKTNARIAVETFDAGQWNGGTVDEVDGAMDFLVFAAAAVRALEVNEPGYLQNDQFKAVFAMLAEESATYIERGLAIPNFNAFHARELREHFRSSPESADLRAALKRWLGARWTTRVLGF